MSYILDALRKSERERVLGQVPTLSTAEVQFYDRRKKLWWWIIPALVVVAVTVGLYVFTSPDPGPKIALPMTQPPSAPKPVEAKLGVSQQSSTNPDTVNGQVEVHGEPAPVGGADLVVELTELPLDYRKQFSDMVLNVVSYSQDPKRRFVMIDLQVYREGQRVKAGPRLEQIQADGAVLSYAGTRFMLRP
ncbi:MAG TPA: hypothetical protein ENI80_02365 [Acidiferrobacteraceae bacterium]|nr:hypothetical protein [Acidiferrobacteraceae bacterium]